MAKIKINLLFLLVIGILLITETKLFAQNRYWVYFTDKANSEFDPFNYFDKKAIDRRIKSGVSLYDSTDFPLNKEYIDIVAGLSDSVHCKLRWFNVISVSAEKEQVELLRCLPFVKRIIPRNIISFQPAAKYDTTLRDDEVKLLANQLERMQASVFEEKGYSGEGIRIAVFDAGFPGVDEIPAFEHIRSKNRIIKTWDFARKRENVYTKNPHGTMVLSCIAGMIGDKRIGMATDAEFLLARTEIERETFAEEEYWLQAMEWADKNGADIINSSLAYTYERYYTFEMDGHTSLVSKAANLAANKGILVINAMGNDGNHDWKIMATPADADSVLSVGAINPITDFHAGFSSYGPTAEYKLKPNVVAFGRAIVAGTSELEKAKGTSFAAPLITGFAACAWQSAKYLTNMQLFAKIEESSHLFPYYDYAHGYGVPQAVYFVNAEPLNKNNPTFKFIDKGSEIIIEIDADHIDKNYLQSMNYLYYHIQNSKGYLENYWLIDVYQSKAAIIKKNEHPEGVELRAHYKGFTNSIKLN